MYQCVRKLFGLRWTFWLASYVIPIVKTICLYHLKIVVIYVCKQKKTYFKKHLNYIKIFPLKAIEKCLYRDTESSRIRTEILTESLEYLKRKLREQALETSWFPFRQHFAWNIFHLRHRGK